MIEFMRFSYRFCLALLMLVAFSSYAQATELPDSCDADFMVKVKNRAAAEASRDTVLSQNAIRIADSVMEFSCLSSLLNLNAKWGAFQFSEHTHWRGKRITLVSNNKHSSTGSNAYTTTTAYLPSNSMDNALTMLVWDTVARTTAGGSKVGWAFENFPHHYYGGVVNHTSTAPSGLDYYCDDMNTIWHHAKCDNFLSQDRFTKIGTSNDIRFMPEECSAGTGYEGIDVNYDSDPVITYLYRYDWNTPTSVDLNCNNVTPIQSGLMVSVTEELETTAASKANPISQTYQERTCILPGCFYNNVTGKCEE